MRGRRSGSRTVGWSDPLPVAEAILVALSVASFGTIESDGASPEWLPLLFPVLLAVTVLVHRSPQLWRALRGTARAPSTAGVVWAGLEAVLATGFLAVLAVVVVALLGTLGAAASGAFETAGSGIGFVVGSAVAAGFFAFFLVLTVGGRLVVSAARAVGPSADGG